MYPPPTPTYPHPDMLHRSHILCIFCHITLPKGILSGNSLKTVYGSFLTISQFPLHSHTETHSTAYVTVLNTHIVFFNFLEFSQFRH